MLGRDFLLKDFSYDIGDAKEFILNLFKKTTGDEDEEEIETFLEQNES